tara:strand:+ start:664 stop:3030 length:2367 start_codon:yes stop_codon:yes gene_type:complete
MLNVVEVGSSVAGAWAARLLADQGADVMKLEPPGGDPLRREVPLSSDGDDAQSGLFIATNLGKRSATADLGSSAGRATLATLLDWADVLVMSLRANEARALELDAARIRVSHPSLVVLAVTPFGHVGPYADFAATELTHAHAGGWASICPMTHEDPELPPLKMHGHHCSMMAGTAAAVAALGVAFDRRRSGVGDFIDFSVQAYVSSVLEFGTHAYTYSDWVVKRTHPRSVAPWKIFETQDGEIFLMIMEPDQWQRLVTFMDTPDWTELDFMAEMGSRGENRDIVHALTQEFIGKWKTMDLYHASQEHRICFAPVMRFADLDADAHLNKREFFRTIDQPGLGPIKIIAPAVLKAEGRAPYSGPAPAAGEHSDEVANLGAGTVPDAASPPRRPLEGLRVIDMTWVWAGTFGGMNLAHLGADVIRIESSVRPDLYRRGGGAPEGVEPSLNTAGMFNQWNQGKRSVAVDLRHAEGIEIVKSLVAGADVLIQNFATGVLARLGLGYEVLREINPRIVLANISGYGQRGPYKDYMAYGPAVGPLSGLSSASGYPGGGPEETGLAMPDPTAGITAVYGVLAALHRREVTGVGEEIDVSLWEASAALNIDGWMTWALTGSEPTRIGNRSLSVAPHGAYPAMGIDQWVTIACATDEQWQALRSIVPGLEGPRFDTVEGRKANEDDLDAAIAAWTREYDRWYVTALLQAGGVAAFPSMTVQDVIEDSHNQARGFIEALPHPEVGARRHTGIPYLLTERPNGVQRPAPCLGQHSREVLGDVLGYSDEQIDALDAAGVLQ